MEASEITKDTDGRSSSKSPTFSNAPEPPKALSVLTVPGPGAFQDASVVSGVTDPNYMDINVGVDSSQYTSMDPAAVRPDDLPDQVVLAEGDELTEKNALNHEEGTTSDPEPLVVTELFPDAKSTVSTSAIPDPPPSLVVESQRPHAQSTTEDGQGQQHPNAAATPTNATSDERIDEYIKSPEVQNAIVERSPGGRYLRFMEKLGSGASKDVYRAYDTQEGIEVAWNVVNLSGVPKMERNRIVNEVRLLERLHHHNIISFHGSWVNRERQEVNFVTEILSSGTLKSFINKVQVIRWKIAKRWAIQILKGLEYLHSQDPPVIHRDLKCENIFINGTSGDLRIGDLGLSTVHRNGRVLSVLGTPEFMAPDMYEENSYDEKVDIYAFGMCMLEIFTQEIPYSECNNPAQIYKKVSSGEAPEVLHRLQSRHAREFVEFCLGYKGDDGKYVRPSASDLLQHPFLVKRANDDDEVVVYPTLRERTIAEAPNESASPSSTPLPKNDNGGQGPGSIPAQTQSNPAPSSNAHRTTPPSSLKPERKSSTNSLAEEVKDTFEDMPENEANFRKVKVMMGRGQEWTESTDESPGQEKQADHFEQYLVAAAVIENESPHIRPYADDILKLVVTLPVEGQTQNVQFDFHLVEDDPVQVAKEMVQELGIPQGAVLEISETISGLARAARMKQDKHSQSVNALQQNQPQDSTSKVDSSFPGESQSNEIPAQPEDVSNQVQLSAHSRTHSQGDRSEASVPSTNASDPIVEYPHVTPPKALESTPENVGSVSMEREDGIVREDSEGYLGSSLPTSNADTSVGEEDSDSDDDEELKAELRKLDEDYQKNLQRAKKVYDNRMDNLQRSQIEREAQHQKTLEKHEKERAEFEKRLAQEEEQQMKRIEQMQKEWDERREKLATLKKKQQDKLLNGTKSTASMQALQQEVEAELNEAQRSSSDMASQEITRTESTSSQPHQF